MAAVNAPMGLLNQVLQEAFTQYASIVGQPLTRYQGTDSAALLQKWQDMVKHEDGPQTILRLVWTDLMASATVGTKGRVSLIRPDGSQIDSDMDTAPVTYYNRRITYDWKYGIPAFVLLAGWLVLWGVSLLVATFGKLGLKTMKQMLRDTSLGRIAARDVDPAAHKFSRTPTKEWSKHVGHVKIDLGHHHGGVNTPGGDNRPNEVHEMTKFDTDSATQQLLDPYPRK